MTTGPDRSLASTKVLAGAVSLFRQEFASLFFLSLKISIFYLPLAAAFSIFMMLSLFNFEDRGLYSGQAYLILSQAFSLALFSLIPGRIMAVSVMRKLAGPIIEPRKSRANLAALFISVCCPVLVWMVYVNMSGFIVESYGTVPIWNTPTGDNTTVTAQGKMMFYLSLALLTAILFFINGLTLISAVKNCLYSRAQEGQKTFPIGSKATWTVFSCSIVIQIFQVLPPAYLYTFFLASYSDAPIILFGLAAVLSAGIPAIAVVAAVLADELRQNESTVPYQRLFGDRHPGPRRANLLVWLLVPVTSLVFIAAHLTTEGHAPSAAPPTSPQKLWETPLKAGGDMLVAANRVFVFGPRNITVLDARTGRRIRETAIPKNTTFAGELVSDRAPHRSNGRIYFKISRKGLDRDDIFAIDLNGQLLDPRLIPDGFEFPPTGDGSPAYLNPLNSVRTEANQQGAQIKFFSGGVEPIVIHQQRPGSRSGYWLEFFDPATKDLLGAPKFQGDVRNIFDGKLYAEQHGVDESRWGAPVWLPRRLYVFDLATGRALHYYPLNPKDRLAVHVVDNQLFALLKPWGSSAIIRLALP